MKKLIVLAALAIFAQLAEADNGNDWNKSSQVSRREEVSRILNNIKAKGCTVKYGPDYYVRQLNDFYADKATYSIKVHEALALIATAVGESWC